jgi:hypothetical protein
MFQDPQILVARASFYGVDIHTPQDVNGGEGTPGRMAGD